MSIVPILLDDRPGYLGDQDVESSLLLLPTGDGALLDEVVAAVEAVTRSAPYVLPRFDAGPRYRAALAAASERLAGVLDAADLRDPLAHFDQSDLLLVIDVESYPVDGLDLHALVEGTSRDARMIRHLLAFESAAHGTKELVQSGGDGRVRRVQRYFAPVTWPFPAGIVASLLPVSCVLAAPDALSASLADVRSTMSMHGIPSQDVPYPVHLLHLNDEVGALALAERRVLGHVQEATAERGGLMHGAPLMLDPDVQVHPSARFLGPVVLAPGVHVDEGALVIGPALIGRDAHVGRQAIVAQSLVVARARVPDGAVARHRVVVDADGAMLTARSPDRRQSRREPAPVATEATGPLYPLLKRYVEPALALGLLVVLSPLLLVLAVCVRLDSPGPSFYGDPREGKGGRPFRCWKFRSMRSDAEALQRALAAAQRMDGPQFKLARDPRVTRVGTWLRRLNIDELPQLWNVVRGEMSFVGPRPSPFRENQICVPWRNGRLSVRPGLTGLWQVCRRDREAGDFHQWIHYDLLYVRHQSLRLDVRIALATLLTLGGRRPTPLERILPEARGHTPRQGHVPRGARRSGVSLGRAAARAG